MVSSKRARSAGDVDDEFGFHAVAALVDADAVFVIYHWFDTHVGGHQFDFLSVRLDEGSSDR
ncbi:hypothetical protein [Nocardia nova]|uniref:hypothetical protein n=1 Tax=Nocardia nova TaxID=37330 RepID=UPI0018933265|nr:hypothetical protein [Nocardia nova]MBF6150180.1 hypothetical protein [Nocardia nova]MDN2495903.1 hypothetical protein [Nocardia nova]